MFVAAIAICLAVVNVYFRDIQHLTGVALQLVFFLTPIIYPVTSSLRSGTASRSSS